MTRRRTVDGVDSGFEAHAKRAVWPLLEPEVGSREPSTLFQQSHDLRHLRRLGDDARFAPNASGPIRIATSRLTCTFGPVTLHVHGCQIHGIGVNEKSRW